MTMEVETINDDKLAEITNLLKTHIPNWAELMSRDMSADTEWKKAIKKECNTTNVYNIGCGKVESQFRRRIYAKCGAKLLLSVVKNARAVSNNLEEALSSYSS